MKVKIDFYYFFSILFIVLVILLTLYPVIGFYFTTYISSPHDLSPGSSFIYYAMILPHVGYNTTSVYVAKLNFTYVDLDEYLIDVELYRLEGPGGISVRPIREGGFTFSAERVDTLCNARMTLRYQNSSLVRMVMPKVAGNVSIVNDVKYLVFEKTGSYMGRGFLSLSYPEKYLGFAWGYRGVVVNTTSNSSIAEIATFVRIDKHYLAYQVVADQPIISQALLNDFGHLCPVLHNLVEADLKIASELSYTDEEMLQLNYTDIVPSDQAWLRVFWDNFNALAPVSYALVAMALILIILRVRRG
uniref:Uncharacterized protein n=1 Tax=Ignisphaera aggregans TaxID=334771 RepID=A0A7J2TAZ4_9CREN